MKTAGWMTRGLFLLVLFSMTVHSFVETLRPAPKFQRSPSLNLAAGDSDSHP